MKSKILIVTGATMVFLLFSNVKTVRANVFDDVSIKMPGYWAIEFLTKYRRVIMGYGDNTFRPNQKITRAEALKLVLSADLFSPDIDYGEKNCFEDVFDYAWYASVVCTAKKKNIVKGYEAPNGRQIFKPEEPIVLAEALKLMFREFEPEKGEFWYNPFFAIAAGLKIIPSSYEPGRFLTRVEFAELLAKKINRDKYDRRFFEDAILAGKEFVIRKLMSNTGAVYQSESDLEITAESIGLMLNIAALSGDSGLFHKIYEFMTNNMQKENPLVPWKFKKNLEPYSLSSATIDDFQIIRGLLRGYEKFKQEIYKDSALKIADVLKKYGLRDNVITSAVSWDANGIYSAPDLILAYADLETMEALVVYDPEWHEIYANTIAVMMNEFIGDKNFYATKYIFKNKKYEIGEPINTLHQALTALHAGTDIRFFRNEYLKSGKIVTAYTVDGRPASNDEDVAIYGILGRLAKRERDSDFELKMIEKITSLQITDLSSSKYGAFAWGETESVYSFSQLNALYFLLETK